ncbi:hypothetical protein IE53DRAFT_155393 [Violaceomyces palustris]|uniref:Uncharacterized protein n=1 Tax=Violaceomyces palustris TaxID=1673888 RepID=A0ACD0NTT9_9BASI|nr:hypothetical protein IE53DRAFT_155393 [Violaceomyces palustris]
MHQIQDDDGLGADQHSSEGPLASTSSFPNLPPMPVPYEEFDFSLDLPDDLDLNDLQFLSSPDRKGGPSNPLTPGITAALLSNLGSHQDILEDTHMISRGNSRANSRRNSFSKRLASRPQSPRASTIKMDERPDSFGGSLAFGLKPPPPPDFAPPPGSSLFGGGGTDLFGEQESHHHGLKMTSRSNSQGGQNAPPGSQSLFDAQETSFLVNFLEGFEWEFDPSLPEGMPSFAAAAAERANQAAEALGLNMEPGGSMTIFSNGIAVEGLGKGKGRSGSGSASASGTGTGSSQSPNDSSSAATSPPVSGPKAKGRPPPEGQGRKKVKDAGAASILSGDGGEGGGVGEDEESDGTNVPGGKRNGQSTPTNRLTGPGKKIKVEHGDGAVEKTRMRQASSGGGGGAEERGSSGGPPGSKRELLTESEKRQNHILSEQRRRNYIREGFKELVVLLDEGRGLGARALGLSSGAGTGVEDEGLDDRTDVDSEDDCLAFGRKKPPKKAKRMLGGGRGRGKGRGRGGSAGGGAGSKSAVLFQAVDLIEWLNGKNEALREECEELEAITNITKDEPSSIATILHG